MKEFNEKRQIAQKLHLQNSLAEAEKIYRYLISKDPQDCDIANLGAALRKQGRHKEAIMLYEEWLIAGKREVEVYLNAINCALECNEFERAHEWVKRAQRLHRKDNNIAKANARYLICTGKIEEAVQILKEMKKINCRDSEIDIILGQAYYTKKQYNEALEIYDKMMRDETRVVECASNIITILSESGRKKDAASFIDKLDKELKDTINIRKAIAFLELCTHEYDQSSKKYEILIHEQPNEPLNWLNYCAAERGLKNSYSALKIIKRGFILHPGHDKIRYAMMQCFAESGRMEATCKMIQEEVRTNKNIKQELMFNLQFMGEGYKLLEYRVMKEMAQEWEERCRKNEIQNVYLDNIRTSIKRRKIRIGYFSQDFCNHPVGRFIKPIIRDHNRSRFDVSCIHTGIVEDNITNEIKESCNYWLDINKMSDYTAIKRIADLQLDIIIELGGYTGGSKIKLLCSRCAPLQLSYLGYFSPTYLKSIDGWIGDDRLFSKNDVIHRTAHKQLKVKGGYMAYKEELDVKKERIKDKKIRIGSFNHARKLSKETLILFSKIMEENINVNLVLKSINFKEKEAQKEMIDRLKKVGIDQDRVEILPWVEGRENHLHCYKYMDIALDPFPYGGATTTCEALYMGVPVITLKGESMVENLSASILDTAGKSEWIAENRKSYIEITTKLIKKGVNTSEMREELSREIAESDLGDTMRLTTELEAIYVDELTKLEKELSKQFINDDALPKSLD